ncbi:SDR family oxidoreductase [Actinomadura macrotermitis]|uniref:Uncharacterized protein n=1 Tax=Actinomadura macrotermitis TaxID=2585200 RepID=A0A7K0BXI8_9ACTN|nr:short-chain dehydrogenase [Actinomadura macrotermitis]MQY05796.1 hypothetical protein [Actinomadura macrotermitis]
MNGIAIVAGGSAALARDLRGAMAEVHPVDACDGAAVEALAGRLGGGVDAVVVAGAEADPAAPPAAQVRGFVAANNHGTHRMITAFGPLLNDGGRFVVVAGPAGRLRHLPARLRPRFDVSRLTLPGLAAVLDDYVAAVEAGRAAAAGWPAWIEVACRVGQVAAVKIMARDLPPGRGVAANAACPGTADVLWLAAPGNAVPNGELVRNRVILPF